MSKNFKAVLSALLCAVMLFVLCACNSDIAESGGESSGGQSEVSKSEADNSEPAPEIVTLTLWHPDWFGYASGFEDTDPRAASVEAAQQYFEANAGVRIEMLWQSGADDLSLRLASGETVDLFMAFPNEFLSWQKQNLLLPLSDLIDKYGPNIRSNVNPGSLEMCKDSSGEIWGLPNEACPCTVSISFREDWLEDAELDIPATIDELDTVLAAFKERDPSKYPMLDGGFEYATSNCFGLVDLLAGAFSEAGNRWWMNDDGRLMPPEMHPDYKLFLAQMQEWYLKGYIHPETYFLDANQRVGLITSGDVGVYADWYTNVYEANRRMVTDNDGNEDIANAEFLFVAAEKPISGTAAGGISGRPPADYYYVVHKKCENPEAAVRFLDLYCSAEGVRVCLNGFEGVNYELADPLEIAGTSYPLLAPITDDEGNATFPTIYFHMFDTISLGAISEANYYNTAAYYYDTITVKDDFTIIYDADLGFIYDLTETALVRTDIDTFFQEAYLKVVTGLESVDWWDTAMEEWLAVGMQTYIDERNTQYQALLAG